MATVIAITNQKGGVGKTSTSTALATGLSSLKGYRTLLIDADPQCNSTDTYRAVVEGEGTLYDLFHKEDEVKNLIQRTDTGDILACDSLLRKADNEFLEAGREYLLKEGIAQIQDDYDFIIIDTTPYLGIMLANAITAADYLIIPILADRYSLQGLSQLGDTITSAKKYTNPNLKIMGLLITMYQGYTRLSKQVIDALPVVEQQFGTKTFQSKIRYTVKVKEASTARESIFSYDAQSNAAYDYKHLIDEIIAEIKKEGK